MISKHDFYQMLVNPYYAISVDRNLTDEHNPMISKEEWIKANKNLIKEIGLKQWMHRLLDCLEGDYPKGSDSFGDVWPEDKDYIQENYDGQK